MSPKKTSPSKMTNGVDKSYSSKSRQREETSPLRSRKEDASPKATRSRQDETSPRSTRQEEPSLSKPGSDRKMNLLLDEKPEGQGMPKKIDRPQSEKQESLEEIKKMDRHLNEKPKDPGVDKRDHRQKQRRGSPAGAIRKT